MYVKVPADGSDVSVRETDDLRRLHVAVAGGLTDADVHRLLADADAGTYDPPEYCWLDIAYLRAAVASSGSATGFEAMLAFAGEHGWLDARATSVRAHVIRDEGKADQ